MLARTPRTFGFSGVSLLLNSRIERDTSIIVLARNGLDQLAPNEMHRSPSLRFVETPETVLAPWASTSTPRTAEKRCEILTVHLN